MSHPRATSNLVLSLVAAASSVVLVLAEGHVQVDLLDVSTWGSVIAHKCGCVMLACLTWAMAEAIRSVFFLQAEEAHTAHLSRWRAPRTFAGRMLQ